MADKRGSSRGAFRRELEPETKFISKVKIFYLTPFTFILEACKLLYLYVASIHVGVKVE